MHQEEAIHTDHFLTLKKGGEGLYKEKGSKFIAYAYPASTVEQAMSRVDGLKAKYHDARHYCFAYRLNPEQPEVRANDDGEPSNSAGAPIYNQILAHELWNVIIVVVRYFGGTKLGVSGLVSAYKEAARQALDNSTIIEKYIVEEVRLRFKYPQMNEVMRLIKDMNLNLIDQDMGLEAEYLVGVRKNDLPLFIEKIKALHLVDIV